MKANVLAEMLTRHAECSQEGKRFLVPSHIALTLFSGLGEESLVIDRVSEVALEDEILVATTSRGERYVVLSADIRALRVTGGRDSAGY